MSLYIKQQKVDNYFENYIEIKVLNIKAKGKE